MGMTCGLYRIDEEGARLVRADPAQLQTYLGLDVSSGLEIEEVREKGLLGLILRLFPITIAASAGWAGENELHYRNRSARIEFAGPAREACPEIARLTRGCVGSRRVAWGS